MKHYNKIFLLLLVTVLCSNSYSQNKLDYYKNLHHFSENKYGSNNILINGEKYYPTRNNAHGFPYYKTKNYVKSTVFIKNSEFNNVDTKYNLEKDFFVAKVQRNGNSDYVFIQNSYIVDSILVGYHKFVHSRITGIPNLKEGIYEVIYSSKNIYFLSKYVKYHKKVYSQVYPHGKYSELNITRYIFYKNDLYKINNRRDFLQVFKEYKKKLKKFIHLNKFKYKKATILQLKYLTRYCNELVFEKK